MRKKKMSDANLSENEGEGAADLKPPDARLFNHQTNWKHFGQQILCQVRSVGLDFMILTLGRHRQSLDSSIGCGLTRRRRERSLLLMI